MLVTKYRNILGSPALAPRTPYLPTPSGPGHSLLGKKPQSEAGNRAQSDISYRMTLALTGRNYGKLNVNKKAP
jgi:hypothetical protein